MFRTKNRYLQYKHLFEDIAEIIFHDVENCIGVALGGGVGRGWFDQVGQQDIDIYVFVTTHIYRQYFGIKGSHPDWPWVFDFTVEDFLISVQFLDYEALSIAPLESSEWEADDHKWTLSNRWDKSLTSIILQKDNLVSELFARKVCFPKSEQEQLCKKYLCLLAQKFFIDLKMYQKRGLIAEANLVLNDSLHLALKLLYIMRGHFIPPNKWQYWWLRQDTELNDRYWDIYSDCLMIINPNDEMELEKRAEKIRGFFDLASIKPQNPDSKPTPNLNPIRFYNPIRASIIEWSKKQDENESS